jgi:hypothetical protein
MTVDEVTSAAGLDRAAVLAVFLTCGPVFRRESISGSGLYRCLLKPPALYNDAIPCPITIASRGHPRLYSTDLLKQTTSAILAYVVPVTLALRE